LKFSSPHCSGQGGPQPEQIVLRYALGTKENARQGKVMVPEQHKLIPIQLPHGIKENIATTPLHISDATAIYANTKYPIAQLTNIFYHLLFHHFLS
jgi:hypothetical protein